LSTKTNGMFSSKRLTIAETKYDEHKIEGTLESSDDDEIGNPHQKIQAKNGILNDKITVNRIP